MLSFGIYKKQLVFFAILLPILVVAGYLISRHYSSASVTQIAGNANTNNYVVDIEIKKDSSVLINGQVTPRLMHLDEDFDLFRYIAAQEEGVYIESIEIKLHLPEGANKKEIKPNIYAVHGVGQSNFYQLDDKTVIYQGFNLSPSATFTVVAQLPKGLVEFPFWSNFVYQLANMNVYWWFLISVIPFAFTLLYLLVLYYRSINDWRLPKVTVELATPPSNLSPAEVAILLEGKVSNRAISAILVDLARRNYINIIQKDGNFSFGKRKDFNMGNLERNSDLKEYEKILLSKIFSSQEMSSDKEDILFRVSHHVFSRKIAQVYVEIYQVVTAKGYFAKDPVKLYQKNRLFGLMLFFIAFIGLITGLFLSIEPKYYLIFWLMMVFTASLIIKMAPHMPKRSQAGQKELALWLEFKNYLSSSKPIASDEARADLFGKYLPYAIALGSEIEWAKKFIGQSFITPNWYISTKSTIMMEDFVNDLYPIIGFVSKTLTISREPII